MSKTPVDVNRTPGADDPATRDQDRTYDEVVRGKARVDLPPGPQDALNQEPAAGDTDADDPDERAARDAVETVRREDRSASRRADPGFRRKGG